LVISVFHHFPFINNTIDDAIMNLKLQVNVISELLNHHHRSYIHIHLLLWILGYLYLYYYLPVV